MGLCHRKWSIMALIEFVTDSKYKLITSHKKKTNILLFPAYYIKKITIYFERASSQSTHSDLFLGSDSISTHRICYSIQTKKINIEANT